MIPKLTALPWINNIGTIFYGGGDRKCDINKRQAMSSCRVVENMSENEILLWLALFSDYSGAGRVIQLTTEILTFN